MATCQLPNGPHIAEQRVLPCTYMDGCASKQRLLRAFQPFRAHYTLHNDSIDAAASDRLARSTHTCVALCWTLLLPRRQLQPAARVFKR